MHAQTCAVPWQIPNQKPAGEVKLDLARGLSSNWRCSGKKPRQPTQREAKSIELTRFHLQMAYVDVAREQPPSAHNRGDAGRRATENHTVHTHRQTTTPPAAPAHDSNPRPSPQCTSPHASTKTKEPTPQPSTPHQRPRRSPRKKIHQELRALGRRFSCYPSAARKLAARMWNTQAKIGVPLSGVRYTIRICASERGLPCVRRSDPPCCPQRVKSTR